MESITHMVAHSQTNPPLLLHPPLPTLNFQLSIRFPALTLTFLLLTFTAPPSRFSILFSFPFSLFSLTLHFSSHTFFAPLQYFSARSHSPFQLSFHKSLVPLIFTIFFLSTSSIPHSFGLFSTKTFHSISVPLLLRFHSASPLFSFQQQSVLSSIDSKCDLFHSKSSF